MTYLLRSNRGKKRKLKLAGIVTVVFFILAFGFQMLAPSATAQVTHFVALPFWRTQSFFSERFSLFSSFVESRKKIIEENRSLRGQIEEYRPSLLYLDVLEAENQELKGFLGRAEEGEAVLASVLRRPPGILYDTIVIDVGRNMEVEEGDLVLARGNIAIGVIEEVFPRTSRISMFSSSGQETRAALSQSGLAVTTLGRGGGNLELHLPEGVDITVGDLLVLPSLNREILAQVVEIEDHPTDASQTIFAQSPVNLSELSWVVVKKQ